MGENIIHLEPGEKLFSEGEICDQLYHIKQGDLLVYRERNGVEVPLEVIHTGEFIGTVSLLSQEARSASVRAMTHVLLEAYNQNVFYQAMDAQPKWLRAMIKDIVTRLKRVNQALVTAKVLEKKYYPSPLQRASQLARLLSTCLRARSSHGVFRESTVIPIGNFIETASTILTTPLLYLDPIFQAFCTCGLLKKQSTSSGELSLIGPDPSSLEEFAAFATETNHKGTSHFIPEDLMEALSPLALCKETAQAQAGMSADQILTQIHAATGVQRSPVILEAMAKCGAIRSSATKLQHYCFNPKQLQKRIIIENTCRTLLSLQLPSPDKWED